MGRGAFAVLAVLACGCGGMTTGDNPQSGAGSCATMVAMSGWTFRQCTEYTGLTKDQIDTLQKSCMSTDAGGVSTSGAWSTKTCDHTGVIGGCKIGSGSFSATIWFWPISGPGTDITLYKDICTAQSGMWMGP